MALFSTSFFAKCLHVGEDGPGRGHLCHTDTFLVYINILADRPEQTVVVASDQGLPCLPHIQQFYTHSLVVKWTY